MLKEKALVLVFKLLAQVGVGNYQFGDCWGTIAFGDGVECLYVPLEL